MVPPGLGLLSSLILCTQYFVSSLQVKEKQYFTKLLFGVRSSVPNNKTGTSLFGPGEGTLVLSQGDKGKKSLPFKLIKLDTIASLLNLTSIWLLHFKSQHHLQWMACTGFQLWLYMGITWGSSRKIWILRFHPQKLLFRWSGMLLGCQYF